jgi:hypothetical protein
MAFSIVSIVSSSSSGKAVRRKVDQISLIPTIKDYPTAIRMAAPAAVGEERRLYSPLPSPNTKKQLLNIFVHCTFALIFNELSSRATYYFFLLLSSPLDGSDLMGHLARRHLPCSSQPSPSPSLFIVKIAAQLTYRTCFRSRRNSSQTYY